MYARAHSLLPLVGNRVLLLYCLRVIASSMSTMLHLPWRGHSLHVLLSFYRPMYSTPR